MHTRAVVAILYGATPDWAHTRPQPGTHWVFPALRPQSQAQVHRRYRLLDNLS